MFLRHALKILCRKPWHLDGKFGEKQITLTQSLTGRIETDEDLSRLSIVVGLVFNDANRVIQQALQLK